MICKDKTRDFGRSPAVIPAKAGIHVKAMSYG